MQKHWCEYTGSTNMARLTTRYLVAITIILRVVAAFAEANLHRGEQRIRPPARSIIHRSLSTQLLKPDHDAKRGSSIPLDIHPESGRVSREGLQSLGRSPLGSTSTSTSLSKLRISDRSPAAHPSSSLTTRSFHGLDLTSPLNITLQRFHAIVDPTGKAISHYIDFWSKVISAATDYYAHLTPVQDFEVTYGQLKLRLTTLRGDTIAWIILKGIALFALEYAKGGFYAWYYLICYVGPLAIAVTLGLRAPLQNSVVHRIG